MSQRRLLSLPGILIALVLVAGVVWLSRDRFGIGSGTGIVNLPPAVEASRIPMSKRYGIVAPKGNTIAANADGQVDILVADDSGGLQTVMSAGSADHIAFDTGLSHDYIQEAEWVGEELVVSLAAKEKLRSMTDYYLVGLRVDPHLPALTETWRLELQESPSWIVGDGHWLGALTSDVGSDEVSRTLRVWDMRAPMPRTADFVANGAEFLDPGFQPSDGVISGDRFTIASRTPDGPTAGRTMISEVDLSRSGHFSIITTTVEGAFDALAADGDVVALATDSEVELLLRDGSGQLQQAGRMDLGIEWVKSAALEDGYLALGDGRGNLEYWDVSTPSAPVLITSMELWTPGSLVEIEATDTLHEFAIGSSADVRIVRFEPGDPHVVRSAIGDDARLRRLFVEGDVALLGSDRGQLFVVDVSNPRMPEVVGELGPDELFGERVEVMEASLLGDRAVATDGVDVVVIGLDDITSPTILARHPGSAVGAIDDVEWVVAMEHESANRVITLTDSGMLSVVDFQDPESPAILSSRRIDGIGVDMSVVELGDGWSVGTGMQYVVSDAAGAPVGSVEDFSFDEDGTLSTATTGGALDPFMVACNSGSRFVTVAAGLAPKPEMRTYERPASGISLAHRVGLSSELATSDALALTCGDGQAALLASGGVVALYELSSGGKPRHRGEISRGDRVSGIEMIDDLLYVLSPETLAIYDLADLSSPARLSWLSAP